MAQTLAKFAGVPAGGSDNQVLTKTSGSDYAAAWETPSGGGGSSLNARRLNPVRQLIASDTSLSSPALAGIVDGDRVALAAQTDQTEQGIWYYHEGDDELKRPSDFTTGTLASGCDFLVMEGSYAGDIWRFGGTNDVVGDSLSMVRVATIPPAGATGQVLTKTSNDDFNVEWASHSSVVGVPSGGTTGQVLTKVSGTDHDLQWATPASGGSPAVISESSDFTLDKDVHTDGCKVLLAPQAGTNSRNVTLPLLANQPAAGYSIEILMTSVGVGSVYVANNAFNSFVGASTLIKIELSYVGANLWYVICFYDGGASTTTPVTGSITNSDA